MLVVTKTRGLSAAVMLSVGTLWPFLSQADQPDIRYTITTPNTSAIGYVTTTSVSIKVTGPSGEAPSNEAIRNLKVTLNGLDEPNVLSQGGTGVLSGLKVGPNTILLLESKNPSFPERTNSWEQVGQLVVERATGPAVSCASLAQLVHFPVQPTGSEGGTTITLAQLNPATATLPEHCQIQGTLRSRTGIAGPSATPQQYQTKFEVRLPTVWNGRYMFQGGGGTEGSLPAATGAQTGTASFPELSNGWVVASQDGGHETSQLPPTIPATATAPEILQVNMFYPDAQAVKDWAYNSIDMTTQTAKYLIDAYYGREADHSYFVGCSTSGRQAMAMTQLFPTYYDGVIAGDPFYLPPDISVRRR